MIKIRDSVGCSIEGTFTQTQLDAFFKLGWLLEEDYLKLHPEDK